MSADGKQEKSTGRADIHLPTMITMRASLLKETDSAKASMRGSTAAFTRANGEKIK